MSNVRVTVGLYRHFKGDYYYVTGLSKSALDEETIMVNYFNVCHPEYGSCTRPLDSFIATHEEDGRVIKDRKDNKTGQHMRFERVRDLNFQLGSVSTEQLIEELRNRVDSPIHELDIEGLQSPVFSKDYVVGVSHFNPEYSKGVSPIVACDTLEQARRYMSNHVTRRDAGIYKRTFIRVE